ncbi:hypothetical protein BC793_15416 [Actinoplanes xinjiangensis]|uniref:Uncharacterized protein n=1 Tax=Actinoplanes xinjiangensis TaxID=512350 RepID=A0A316E9R5_9ACTN|nr:hypothetical protein BC793_15416 [Actinoplanes xinjiangensis]
MSSLFNLDFGGRPPITPLPDRVATRLVATAVVAG